jgi:AcrR family transcriptional regulator
MEPRRTPTSRQRITAAARVQVEVKGILGLRVQDVATEAKVSVPLIYKYYGDRDGLLAEVLGEMFEEFVLEQIFDALENPTVEDLLAVIALPQQDFRRPRRWQRMQILAASVEIPALRQQLGVLQLHLQERLTLFMDNAQRRITGGSTPVSSAALALLVQSYGFGFVLNDLLESDEHPFVTDDQFAHLMRVMLNAALLNQQTPS